MSETTSKVFDVSRNESASLRSSSLSESASSLVVVLLIIILTAIIIIFVSSTLSELWGTHNWAYENFRIDLTPYQ